MKIERNQNFAKNEVKAKTRTTCDPLLFYKKSQSTDYLTRSDL